MLGPSELEETKLTSKPPIKKPDQSAQTSRTAPGYLPIGTRTSSFAFTMRPLKQLPLTWPKFSLYEEDIPYTDRFKPEHLVAQLMLIVTDAAARSSVVITPEQSQNLLDGLTRVVAPVREPYQPPQKLLTILFSKMEAAGIPLTPAFVDEVKNACRSYVLTLKNPSIENPSAAQTFLAEWKNLDPDFDMLHGTLSDYRYGDIEHVMHLLYDDTVSTTQDSPAVTARFNAAKLVHDQVIKPLATENQLTTENLLHTLLELNKTYNPQQKFSYKHGLRYHPAQIGQGTDALYAVPPMQVKTSVDLVIEQIMRNLEPCEAQLQSGEPLTEEMLKTVIATSAMAYQLLITIHPFADGNGRTCRMFANYILMRYHLLPATFSSDSAKQFMSDGSDLLKLDDLKNLQGAPAAMTEAIKSHDQSKPGDLRHPQGALAAMIEALERSRRLLQPSHRP